MDSPTPAPSTASAPRSSGPETSSPPLVMQAPASRRGLLRPRAGRRLRRRTRWALRIAVALPLLLVLTALIALRSPLVGELVAREVGAKLGCEFSGRGSLLNLGGKLVISRPRLSVPGLDGEQARFMQADRAEIDLDWTRGLFAGPRPTRVRLISPVLRVSVAVEDGSLNLDGLAVGKSSAGGSPPPAVDIVAGRLELGEHSLESGVYTRLTSVPVSGQLAPVKGSGDAPAYGLRLSQTGPVSGALAGADLNGRGGMLLEGHVDLDDADAELTLRNVSLSDWPPEVIPTALRDIWRRLNIQGTVSEASFRYTHDRGVQAAVALNGVSMDALVPADRPGSGIDKPLKLTGVTGSIKLSRAGLDALLDGTIGDLPGRVSLRTTGTSLDSPLRCEITTKRFQVSQSPELMPYAPSIVRKRFAAFSGPTALVDARVLIERGPPAAGAPAPLRTSGTIAFENGTAAFAKFAYPFEDMRGLVTFNDERIEFVNIQGRGPTGAIMSAEGYIAPVNDDPKVVVDVLALDMPVDHVLHDAMPSGWSNVLGELFNEDRYHELLDKGLIITPQRQAELRRALADAQRAGDADRAASLERALRTPAFELGGTAQVGVRVTREAYFDAPFGHSVEVVLPRAGVLPEGFPLPIIARDVVLRIDEDRAEIVSGTFEGLTGGTAEVTARIDLRDADGAAALRPDVTVRASGVPVGPLLINAIPDRMSRAADAAADEPEAPRNAAPRSLSPKALLTALNLDGTVSCEARVTPAPEGADRRISVDVSVGIDGLTASPRPVSLPDALRLEGLTGAIHVNDDGLTVESLRAGILRRGGEHAGDITIDVASAFGGAGSTTASVAAGDLDLAAPIERLVALISESTAETVAGIRQKQNAQGRVDARLDIAQAAPGADPEIELHLDAARDLRFDALGGRFALTTTSGSAALALGGGADRVAFSRLAGDLAFNGQKMMDVELDGATRLLAADAPQLAPGDADAVSVRISGAKVESDLSQAALRAILGRGSAAPKDAQASAENPGWLDKLDPRGEFDADLTVRPRIAAAPMIVGAGVGAGPGAAQQNARQSAHQTKPGGPRIAPGRYELAGSVWPRSLSLVYNGTLIDLPSITGRVVLDPHGGSFDKIRAAAAQERWHLGLDGAWQSRRESYGTGVRFDSTVTLAASSLDSTLAGLLPKGVRAALDKARFKMDGPFSVDGAKLVFWLPTGESARPPSPQPATDPSRPAPTVQRVALGDFLFDGQIQLTDLSANVGVPIHHGAGALGVLIRQNNGEASPTVDLSLRSDSLSLGGVPLTGARGRLVSGSRPGQFIVPQFVAEVLGGRLSLAGVLDGISAGRDTGIRAGAGTSYQATATLAGTRFAPLLDSIELGGRADPDAPRRRTPNPGDESRGRVDASVSLSGTIGKDETRVGRGSVRVAGGDVVQLPGLVRMIELSNLQVPSGERLDYVQAGFDLKGHKVTFEEVAVMSESLTITGDGNITLPEMGLDFRFNSQAAPGRRIPLVSGVFEALRNELVTTVVGGTLKKPKVRTESLSGTRRLFSGLVGKGDPEPRSDAKSVAKNARTERERLRSQRAAPGAMAPAVTLPGSAPRTAAPQPQGSSGFTRVPAPLPPSGDLP